MCSLYIIEGGKSGYKIGVHSGCKGKLIKRYITALPSVRIYRLFNYSSRLTALKVENHIKNKYYNNRIINANGNASEWFDLKSCELNSIEHYASIFLQKLNINTKTIKMDEKNMCDFTIQGIQDLLNTKVFGFPEYQRPVKEERLEEIKNYFIETYNKPTFYVPEVVLNKVGNRINIIDGQHRICALGRIVGKDREDMKDFKLNVVLKHNLSEEDEKKIFLHINKSIPCPGMYLHPDIERKILEQFRVNFKKNFGNKIIKSSSSPRTPHISIDNLIQIMCTKKDDLSHLSYISNWFRNDLVSSGDDLTGEILKLNNHIGVMLMSKNSFSIYKNIRRGRGKSCNAEKLEKYLTDAKKKAFNGNVCYLGFVDSDHLIQCMFDLDKLF